MHSPAYHRHRLGRATLFALTLIGQGCGAASPDDLGQISASIRGGGPAPHDQAVVALLAADGQPLCTGVLIAPAVVLTAAHCIGAQSPGTRPAQVFSGPVVGGPGATAPVALFQVSPLYDGFSISADIGLVLLAATIPAAPVPLATSDGEGDDPTLGPVRLVGFGFDDEGVKGTRRSAQGTAVAITGDGLQVHGGACFVDSGGPALAPSRKGGPERVAAVISSGDRECTISRATLVSRHAAWIEERLDPLAGLGDPCGAAAGCSPLLPCARANDGASAFCESAFSASAAGCQLARSENSPSGSGLSTALLLVLTSFFLPRRRDSRCPAET